MATEWPYMGNAIATNLQIGNALAGAIGFETGDALTFTKGRALRPIGSQSTTPTAWASQFPLKQTGHDRVSEFNTDGPHPSLTALGMSGPQIAAGKAAVIVESGPRAEIRARWNQFLADNGYEVIPQ